MNGRTVIFEREGLTWGTRYWAALFVLVAAQTLVGQRIVYVDRSAAGTNDGSSWENAYLDLQDALDDAEQNGDCPCEIWVAEGTYNPDRGTGDRFASFRLLSDVTILGGFGGWETECDERDPFLHEVILNGDLSENDAVDPEGTSPCCKGNASIPCDDQACRALVCSFEDFCCEHWGTLCETYAEQACCDLCRRSRCDNSINVLTAANGAENAVLDGITVTGGEANNLEPNDFGYQGGGIYLGDVPNGVAESLVIKDCLFRDNAGWFGSAVYASNGRIDITDSTFIENYSFGSDPAVTGVLSSPVFTFSNSQFIRNRGGGIRTDNSTTITKCAFIENDKTLGPNGGAIKVNGGTNVVDCIFVANKGRVGGAIGFGSGTLQVINSSFIGNSAKISSGAIALGFGGAMLVVNSTFSGNYALEHSATFAGSATVLNCTFVKNWTVGNIGGPGATSIANSIMWGNMAGGWLEEQQFYIANPDETNLRYNCIEGWEESMGGIGNVGFNPLFVDGDGPDNISGTADDNVRLSPESSLINLGDPDPPLAPFLDADGHARTLCGRIDMGAYEYGIGDYDCDRVVELSDFIAFPACMIGPNGGPYANWCEAFDFHAEIADHIDLLDVAGLQRSIGDDWP